MTKQDFVDYWMKSSEHDLYVAESLFNSGHFDYCLFIAHLSLEKILKALWVKDNMENNPPKTHNLVFLAKNSNLNLNDEQLRFLQFVNTFNIGTRYPDYKFRIYQMCNKKFTKENFEKIKEYRKWLMKKL